VRLTVWCRVSVLLALWCAVHAIVAPAGPTASNFTKYIMWIPGRGGSTWTTEMMARSHPNILAHMEIFSGAAGLNLLGAGRSCGDTPGVGPAACLEALDKYWSNADDVLPPQRTPAGKTRQPNRTHAAAVVAKGFKVRPTVGWATDEVLRAYAERDIRFVCNTRLDSLRHGISMYRHGLSRGQTKNWKQIERMYGDGLHNDTRVIVPAGVLSSGKTEADGLRLSAECTVKTSVYTNPWGHQRAANIWLADCAQNITYPMFDYIYARADRLMKAVHSICLDYTILHSGEVHWLNYEMAQHGPQREVDSMAEFLSNRDTGADGPIQTSQGLDSATVGGGKKPVRHKTTATHGDGLNAFLSSVPNIEQVVAGWWNRSGCTAGMISDVMLPLHMHGTGGLMSTHSIKTLLFAEAIYASYPPRPLSDVGQESPFVVLGSGLPWVGRLFSTRSQLRHAVVEGSTANDPPLSPDRIRCDGGCDPACRKAVVDFVTRRAPQPAAKPAHRVVSSKPGRGLGMTGLTVTANSLVGWASGSRASDPVIVAMATRKSRLVCAVWENAIEGGLARLHESNLRRRGLDPQQVCRPHVHGSATTVAPECTHTLDASTLREAINAVAIETFSTLRFCRDYALAAGHENVFVVSHRAPFVLERPTEHLTNLATFLGLKPWPSDLATAHATGSYHRFFPTLATALRTILHAEAHIDVRVSLDARKRTVCLGCDAYSVADTLSLLHDDRVPKS
jgi:hypothetical protein